MKLLYEKNVTVTTAGTPVVVTAVAKGINKPFIEKLVFYNNYTDTTVFAIGLSATVDANSTPPIGVVLAKGDSFELPIENQPELIYIDSSASGGKITVHYYGSPNGGR